jgi:Zn-dependent oligopeptidase
MAADAADFFSVSPEGLYDRDTAHAWSTVILASGHSKPADEAFRAFAARDPSPRALQRRFGLARSEH